MTRALSLLCALPLACAPDLTVHASRVTSARVVAVRAEPAEARPGDVVTLRAVVATPRGEPSPAVRWRVCPVPRAANESTTVSPRCLADGDGGAGAALGDPGGDPVRVEVPFDACMQVGPQSQTQGAAGERARAPDPDITGGWQLPIRVDLAAGASREPSFARVRVRCQPPDVPGATAAGYARAYRDNENPVMLGVFDAAARELPRGEDAEPLRVDGARVVPLQVLWRDDASEAYVRVDPVTRGLVTRAEALEVAWFTDGGAFDRDRTAPDATGTASQNVLRLDVGVDVARVWVVLRDERGGVDAALVRVAP